MFLAGAVGAPLQPAEAQGAPLAPAARSIPGHVAIADSTFWGLVTGFSEPGGWFRSENFVSNEMEWQHVIPAMQHRVAPGRAYVGVGPEQNFTYVAALDPAIAFIVDIRRQNLAQHLLYKALFELAPTRVEFLSLLFARPRPEVSDSATSAELVAAFDGIAPDTALFHATWRAVWSQLTETHGFPIDSADRAMLLHVDSAFAMAGPSITYAYVPGVVMTYFGSRGMPTFAELMEQNDGRGRNRSFLASETEYRAVRTMQLQNRIVPVTGDFAGPSALRAVGAWLVAHDMPVGAFYLSNVEQYLFRDASAWPRFYQNVASFPINSASVFIRSVPTSWGTRGVNPGPIMRQRLSSIGETLEAVRGGVVRGYADVIMVGW